MGLRFDPVGGGQFKQAIKQIIEAESVPLKNMEARKGREEAKLKLFEDFKGKFTSLDRTLGDMSSFQKFRELKADLSDGQNLMSVTLDKERAQPGSFTIEIQELAARTSVISNGFEDPDEPCLGIGFITMNAPTGESVDIFVDESRSSLRGVADLINRQKECPVRAMVIRDSSSGDDPWKLILSAKKDGKDNQLDIPEFYFLDGTHDFYVDSDREAKNALVYVDGFPIELSSNHTVDFFPGVNVHLKQARPEEPFTLTITEDFQKVSGKIKNLVDQFNGLLGFINKQNAIDQASDTRSTFAGDSSLQTVEYRMRNIMHEGFPIGDPEDEENFRILFLSELGIEFDKTGMLQFKEDKFMKAIERDFEGAGEALTGEFGFVSQVKGLLSGYSRPGTGLISNREQGLRNRIKEIDRQIDLKNRNIERRQQSLTDQFARLSAALSDMQRQQQALTASLPSAGGNNLISSLLGG